MHKTLSLLIICLHPGNLLKVLVRFTWCHRTEVNTPEKKQLTAHTSDLTSDKFWIFLAILAVLENSAGLHNSRQQKIVKFKENRRQSFESCNCSSVGFLNVCNSTIGDVYLYCCPVHKTAISRRPVNTDRNSLPKKFCRCLEICDSSLYSNSSPSGKKLSWLSYWLLRG